MSGVRNIDPVRVRDANIAASYCTVLNQVSVIGHDFGAFLLLVDDDRGMNPKTLDLILASDEKDRQAVAMGLQTLEDVQPFFRWLRDTLATRQ